MTEGWLREDQGMIVIDPVATGMPTGKPVYLSVHLHVDMTVAPGLYDDFVLLALRVESVTYIASFGFRT